MREKRCGNAGAVESVESQKQAFPSFHEPLGNLANGKRDSHIPTAPATQADGKVENQKQVFHFPTATISLSQHKPPKPRAGFASPARELRDWESVPVQGAATKMFAPFGPYYFTDKIYERRHRAASLISGSSRIGINSWFQAHFWIGKC